MLSRMREATTDRLRRQGDRARLARTGKLVNSAAVLQLWDNRLGARAPTLSHAFEYCRHDLSPGCCLGWRRVGRDLVRDRQVLDVAADHATVAMADG